MVSSKDKPHNFPIYVVETELGSFILFNELTDEEEDERKAEIPGLKINKHKIRKSLKKKKRVGGCYTLMD